MPNYKGLFVNLISSWPPRICGVGAFADDTAKALAVYEDDILEIKIHPIDKDGLDYPYPVKDKHIIRQQDSASWINAAEMIIARYRRDMEAGIKNVALLEHEYGLDGNGRDNNYNEVVRRLGKEGVPNIVVLHTVRERPDDYQIDVIRQFGENCDRVIVLTRSSKITLRTVYGVPDEKIVHIPHGIPEFHRTMSKKDAKEKFGLADRIVISTTGLVSENKGLEYGIRGFSKFLKGIEDHYTKRLVYLIAGQTHPDIVKKNDGADPYRDELVRIAREEGLNPMIVTSTEKLTFPDSSVIFLNRHLSDNEFVDMIRASNTMLFPYTNPEQDSSGGLAYSIGLGTPAVSTKFRNAVDMFTDEHGEPDGSGVLIGFRNEEEIAEGLRKALAFENVRKMEERIRDKGGKMGMVCDWETFDKSVT